MSTRSLTKFFGSDGNVFCNVFIHHDGYPSGHGAELAEFLNSRVLVNGLDGNPPPAGKVKANGVGRLAAQFIAEFADHEPSIYPVEWKRCDESYCYEVHPGLECGSKPWPEGRLVVLERQCRNRSKTLYDGPWSEYEEWLAKYKEEE